ncbi:potential 3-hydroxydecyl-(acyl carrier protein) dehydratase [Aromatoleum aromaticum EbN1]|uniref:Potential 3-hydroxydecyl-(Acyl carrier protein) dehydratase n=1 Tax=Aromatoleum aromaticum (strain DSM 19018 / LMG 30748 / EbN1) TaxID=76114 RepID=Q5NXS6_AROAE|nr:hotdog family protein [Aromatoleum aromaticum]CAI10138.1 potential 3-hydroxydecyl-(acyl carrier protein) dehydratase [Aromatoleum aromaticum EbN1]
MTSQPATLDRAAIAARIPHHGTMCLLDAVVAWDAESIHCRATSHCDLANPLRDAGSLPTTAAIEYAAQAMAVHGALLAPAGGTPRAGYLASVRSVELAVAHLDGIAGELEIRAKRLTGNDSQVLYGFTVCAAGTTLVSGRAAVILDAGAPGAGLSRSPP